MKKIASIFIATVVSVVAFGSQDRIVPLYGLDLNFRDSQSSYRVVAEMNMDATLEALTLTWDDTVIGVPKGELLSLKNPQLNSIRLLSGAYQPPEKAPYCYISIEDSQTNGMRKEVWFVFSNGKFEKLMIRQQVDEDVWDWFEKVPGTVERKSGTESILNKVR